MQVRPKKRNVSALAVDDYGFVLTIAAPTEPPAVPAGSRTYSSSKEGYRLSIPSSWEETSKSGARAVLACCMSWHPSRYPGGACLSKPLFGPGADVLFVEPRSKAADVGITVSPIRIRSLEQFGDLAAVGNRLLSAERSKVRPSCFPCCLSRSLLVDDSMMSHVPSHSRPPQ